MPDLDKFIERIQDKYDYYSFLELVFGYDHLARDIVEATEVDDDGPEEQED